ncbi:MAG: hypothetical protein GEU87_10920 [Alphaproteobacteria bacterium]|nr:hypothetical protein [Alphaproteobacteria bacterium]
MQRRMLLGAAGLAVFITVCVGWLFQSVGKPVAWWGYLGLLALSASLVYALARLLRKGARESGVQTIDTYKELE